MGDRHVSTQRFGDFTGCMDEELPAGDNACAYWKTDMGSAWRVSNGYHGTELLHNVVAQQSRWRRGRIFFEWGRTYIFGPSGTLPVTRAVSMYDFAVTGSGTAW